MTATDVETLSRPRPTGAAVPVSQATAIEQARAVAEVAAAVRVAQDNPRDEALAFARMRAECDQAALADRAFYSLPRAGGRVEGSTVHLARALALCWGNLDYGIRELRRDDAAGESEMQAWAWDQETNARSSRSFVVPHAIMARGSRKPLTDLGDIANNNNSVAARAVRETIFTVLPARLTSEAEQRCRATLAGPATAADTPAPVADQAEQLIESYQRNVGVTRQQLEASVALPVADWTEQTLDGLRVLASEIARGEKRLEDEFPPPGSTAVTADELQSREGGQS